jgi:O-antigen ligase
MQHNKTTTIMALIVASPLLLEILFFWNNDSYSAGFKSLEKSVALAVFPLFILGNYQRVEFYKILRVYSTFTTYLILLFLIRFFLYFPEYVNRYLNGLDLWETGYSFARSFGNHAPTVNMHLAFISIVNLYFVFSSFQDNKSWFVKLMGLLTFITSFFLILVINTRMALVDALVGFGVVFFYEIIKKYDFKRVLAALLVLLVALLTVFYFYIRENPYMKEKYFTVTFNHMDKIGKLDEFKNPDVEVYNSFVTRVSIWKSALELAERNLPFGVGASDAKPELFMYYRETNQKFLASYDFPTHNQYIDFLLRFGILGILVALLYMFNIAYLGFKTKNALMISFFIIFFTSNITDDCLIFFKGIVYSGLWISIFGSYVLQQKRLLYMESN